MIYYQNNLEHITEEQLKGFFVGWKKPLSSIEHYEILQNSQFIVLAIDDKTNQVVGFINALSDKVKFAFIPLLEVLPEYQNKGIGTSLMKQMLVMLETISNIDLTCDLPLQSFYERFNMLKSNGMVIRKYL